MKTWTQYSGIRGATFGAFYEPGKCAGKTSLWALVESISRGKAIGNYRAIETAAVWRMNGVGSERMGSKERERVLVWVCKTWPLASFGSRPGKSVVSWLQSTRFVCQPG